MIFGHNVQPAAPSEGCSYVARIEFLYGERTWRPGEVFDFRALGLNEWQARDLWVAGRLLVDERKPEDKKPLDRKAKKHV